MVLKCLSQRPGSGPLKRLIQKAVLTATRVTGMSRLLRPMTAGSGAILTFHRVRPWDGQDFAPNAHLEITPEFLQEIVEWTRQQSIDIVPIEEALRRVGSSDHKRFVVLTFDDGFRDNCQWALPILRAAGAPFTVYVATGFIDRSADPWWMTLEEVIRGSDAIHHPDGSATMVPAATPTEKESAFNSLAAWLQSVSEDEQRSRSAWLARHHGVDVKALVAAAFMDWDEVAVMHSEPLVTIGAHTHNHVALARLPRREARHEVVRSADILEHRLGERPRHFAYPYGFPGAVGGRDYRLLRELGFATSVLTSPGVLRPRDLRMPTALPRISVNGYFQKKGYLDALVSGVPLVHLDVARTLAVRGKEIPTPTVSASSG